MTMNGFELTVLLLLAGIIGFILILFSTVLGLSKEILNVALKCIDIQHEAEKANHGVSKIETRMDHTIATMTTTNLAVVQLVSAMDEFSEFIQFNTIKLIQAGENSFTAKTAEEAIEKLKNLDYDLKESEIEDIKRLFSDDQDIDDMFRGPGDKH